jgi:hypothetical protein
MKKILRNMLFGVLIFLLLFVSYLFIGNPPLAKEISWGVNFSQKHAELLGLNWQETYLALLDDLKVKNIKLISHWELIEPEKDRYYFNDLDWQVERAEEKGVGILLVIGMKNPRWPECHIPEWAKNLSKAEQQERILKLIENIVLRYQDSVAINMWQVENEPFFPFGECPDWLPDKSFLEKEIAQVQSLDERPVVISDSGELSLWITAAKLGDIVGTTLHRKVWFKEFQIYVSYPFPPVYYWRKAQIVKKLFDKEVIGVELQAEPWGPTLLYWLSLEEQEKTMNLEQFKKNIEFARKTGLKEFYFWGAEWWYWLKEKQNQPEIWQEAREIF